MIVNESLEKVSGRCWSSTPRSLAICVFIDGKLTIVESHISKVICWLTLLHL